VGPDQGSRPQFSQFWPALWYNVPVMQLLGCTYAL